jgi:hypothetical protein
MARTVPSFLSPNGPELLEARDVPAASFLTAPVVPEIDADMQVHLQQVAARGTALGNRENVFAKAGDSITAYGFGFAYPLGQFGYSDDASGLRAVRPDLVAVRQKYLAPVSGFENSFTRNSLSAYPGWQSSNVVASAAAEVAAIRPGVAVVMVGTNDWVHANAEYYRGNLRQIVRTYLNAGVIPVLSTIPDHRINNSQYEAWALTVNQVVYEVGEELNVPVWNYWKAIHGLPNDGLGDQLHPGSAPAGAGSFGAGGLSYGMNVRNFTLLEVLQKVDGVVFDDANPDGADAGALTTWRPLDGLAFTAVGASRGDAPVVTIADPDTGAVLARFLAYDDAFRGGVNVAVADVNGDGVPDVLTGAGKGGGPVVKAFSGTDGRQLFSTFAFEPTFTGGVSVAAGDLDGDGVAEIVVGAGPGGGPRVRVFRGGTGAVVRDFFAFESTFTGGVNVAVGNFATGPAIVATPGAGGGSVVKLFAGSDGSLVNSFEVFESAYRSGLNVAVSDANGDGTADVVLGAAVGSSRVRAITAAGAELGSFFAGPERSNRGVRLSAVVGRPAKVLGVTSSAAAVYNIFDPAEPVFVGG